MKKKNRLMIYPLVVMGVLLMLTCSCKKGGSDTNLTPTSSKKIHTINYSVGGGLIYEYNSDGKVSKVTSTEGGSITTYIYSGNIITITWLFTGKTYNKVCTLNSQGFISNTNGSDPQGNYIETYQYDNSGYCTQYTFSEGNQLTIFTFKFTNGNFTTETRSENGQIQTWTNEYYLDKENTLGNGSPEQNFMGRPNKNLLKKSIGPYGTYTYTYDFDQYNYVTKQTETRSDGSLASWTTYSYY